MKKGLGSTLGPDFFLIVLTIVFLCCYSFFSIVMLLEDAPILASSLERSTAKGGGVPRTLTGS